MVNRGFRFFQTPPLPPLSLQLSTVDDRVVQTREYNLIAFKKIRRLIWSFNEISYFTHRVNYHAEMKLLLF